jgi:hypothetical protein
MADLVPVDVGRIKGNIQKMIDQGAPESDIDAYVSGEGATPELLRGAPAPSQEPLNGRPFVPDQQNGADQVAFGKDIGRAVGGGLIRGAMAIPDLANSARSGFNWLADKVVPPPSGMNLSNLITGDPSKVQKSIDATSKLYVGSNDAIDLAQRLTGTTLDASAATTPEGKALAPYAQTAAEFLPMAVATGGGAISGGVIPGFVSEFAGQKAQGTGWETPARLAGALAGGVVGPMARRAVTPLPISPERQAFVQTLRDEGVPVTAGQATGSRGLQWTESQLGDLPFAGNRGAAINETQKGAFTAAALRRAGEDATRASPEVMDRAFTRIGGNFDALSARNTANMDPQFIGRFRQVLGDYNNLVEAPNRVPAVRNFAEEIVNQTAANGGTLPGEIYQSLRSRMETVARETSNNEARHAIRGLRGALDGMMERSIGATNPADLGGFQTARNQYRNLLTVDKAMRGAGSDTAQGLLSPSQLRGAVVQQGGRAYVRGQGDFADLARAGEAIMKPLPNSGTAPRAYVANLPTAMIAGATAGGSLAGPIGAAAGGALPLAAPVVGRALLSRPVQSYLANEVLEQTPPGRLARTLLASGMNEHQRRQVGK